MNPMNKSVALLIEDSPQLGAGNFASPNSLCQGIRSATGGGYRSYLPDVLSPLA
jgi:hypothetical protein